MPVTPTVTWVGLNEFRRDLRRLDDEGGWTKELREAGKDAAAVIVPAARGFAPQRSGRLAGSIRPLASGASFAVAAGSANVPYARPIHWGWPRRHIAANQFITRAADAQQSQVLAVFKEHVDRITAEAFPT